MRSWDYALSLERSAARPLFLQIAHAIVVDIRRGRLRPGERLPGTRTLAASAGLHRNTVVAAYRALATEGWITATASGGTWVAHDLPDPRPRRFAAPAAPRTRAPRHPGFDLGPAAAGDRSPEPQPGTLVLGGSAPDLRLLPVDVLSRAYRRALRSRGRDALRYTDPEGHPRLREALAGMLSRTRGLAVGADSVLVTRGSQMALHLVARALVAPGDVVAVEALGYRYAWEAFRLAGARLVPIPIDEEGLDVSALERLAACEKVRAVYVTPHHQFPTTVALSPRRRLRLLALARSFRMALVEDDYDHEFHFDGQPVLPLASADEGGVVIYVGTLSKVLAPGLRIGYVVAPPPLLHRLAGLRVFVDVQGDQVLECAVAELLEEGDVQRHVRRARLVYMERRQVLGDLLDRHLGGILSFERPAGGIALWVKAAAPTDIDGWAARAAARGVVFQTARHFAFDGQSRPAARLGYAGLNAGELGEAVRRLADARRR